MSRNSGQGPVGGSSAVKRTGECSLEPLEAQAADRSRLLLDKGRTWLRIAMPDPVIRFDLRGRAAGQARFGTRGPWVIRYNPVLLRANAEDFLISTVPHEVAHLVAFARYGSGIRPHGPEWRSIMHHFGAEPLRCHRYDVSQLGGRSLREFAYHCDCREHRLSSIRHNRVRTGQVYLCRRCATPLRPGPQPRSS